MEGDLNAVKCFIKCTGKPLGQIPVYIPVLKADDLNRLGFEPKHIQVLIKISIEENGEDNFVGLFQAA